MRGKQKESERLPNPAAKFLTYKGAEKGFIYYDKSKEENVNYPLKDFLILTTRTSIGGWSDANTARIWSNEVDNITQEELYVMAGKEKITEGFYQDIKDKVKAEGGCFQSIIYAYVPANKELVRICLSKSNLGAFADYTNEQELRYQKVETVTMTLTGSEDKKKGATKYTVPTFGHSVTKAKDEEAAVPFVNSLEDYLTSLKSVNKEEDVTISEEVVSEKETTDLPF